MHVHDLIKILQAYPPDTVVATTWEGTFHEIRSAGIYLRPVTEEMHWLDVFKGDQEFLLIDADGETAEDFAHYGAHRLHQ